MSVPSVDQVAAGLRAMGYSEGQARALAGDPVREPARLVARQHPGTPTRVSAPVKAQKTRKLGAGDPRRFAAGPAWGRQRKADMVAYVRDGLVSIPDLWTRYGITAEEFTAWCAAFDARGVKGLCATVRETAP